jgi:hypothetical protein
MLWQRDALRQGRSTCIGTGGQRSRLPFHSFRRCSTMTMYVSLNWRT